ncbi:aminotransferase class I/II-fold pyridoxal phosphate-dependent enzyme [Streptomyces armeniacus]|uniref:Aminotransferase class I/II-fold pyridoxal phosphate-dependent enzyme n=1 Tax=Streptomyces armeniacus TaxID=83291 RepID=A0A345XIE1_9ACTN|nr:aminotransferase class I/II-fold pyridoxal phosphate-dependent enzyme [Streptomyces armeniacus]AXK31407.1 aminotransferase class I/II-fold pyridoxal phosphate-dependent enzyme [Streptomyces armeniacus]
MRHTDVATAACGYWHRRGLHTEPGQVVTAPGAPLLLLALLAGAAATPAGPAPGALGERAVRREAVTGATAAPGVTAAPGASAAPGQAPAAGGPPEGGGPGGAPPGGQGPTGQGPGAVLLPRPSAAWHAPQARLLGRPVHPVPVPAECGGVPDPFALLEAVRRARADGGDPRVLLLSVADDPTGTTAPPELLHEVCEAAVNEGLLIVSDESWRDTSHSTRDTVVVSPAEMVGDGHADSVVVLAGLNAALLPPGLSAGIARFPDSDYGRALGDHVREVLGALHTGLHGPDADAAAEALAEPAHVRERRAAEAALHGAYAAALHDEFTAAGALCRPPQVGRHLYVDLEQSRTRLAAHGIEDAAALEAELVRRLGPYATGGHRVGDDPLGLRVRISTEVLAAGVPSADVRAADVRAADVRAADVRAPGARPMELPGVPEALEAVHTALAELLASD